MGNVNSKPVDPRLAVRAKLAETDLRVEYMKHCRAYLIGTRAQLEAEEVPEICDKWPNGRGLVRWTVGELRFSMELEGQRRLKNLYGHIPEEPRYRLWVERSTFDFSMWGRAQMLEKLDELKEIKYRWSDEHTAVMHLAFRARDDERFQSHLVGIIQPTMPRKGGRPSSRPAV